MSRSGKTPKRTIENDPVYNSHQLTKLVNKLMRNGKKQVAYNLVYRALEMVKTNLKVDDPLETFRQALENIKPNVEVRSRRVGGAAYQVPVPVKGDRKESLAIRWLIAAARARSSKDFHTFADKLSTEIMEASQGKGGAVKRKQDTHRMAEGNRAFAHFRW
jgi:small subunit ribosomal protein S7